MEQQPSKKVFAVKPVSVGLNRTCQTGFTGRCHQHFLLQKGGNAGLVNSSQVTCQVGSVPNVVICIDLLGVNDQINIPVFLSDLGSQTTEQ
jgi:hypothetical protein